VSAANGRRAGGRSAESPAAGHPPVSEDLLADYNALRHGVGAVDDVRDVVIVTGPQAGEYLQGQCSQELTGLEPDHAVDALLLEPDGKLSALVRIVLRHDGSYLVDVDRGWGDALLARLMRFRLRTKVEITRMHWPSVALRGEQSADRLDEVGHRRHRQEAGADLSDEGPDALWAVPVEWGGSVGVDLIGPGALKAVPTGARWSGEEAYTALRIESGIPVMGRELDDKTIAAEAGLLERCVSFTKGCYTGQELIARLDARGNRVARRLVGVVIEGPEVDLDAGELAGTELWPPSGDKLAGSITSAAWCPGIGAWAGLGYLHRSVPVPAPVEVRTRSSEGRPEGNGIVATARPLPLVEP